MTQFTQHQNERLNPVPIGSSWCRNEWCIASLSLVRLCRTGKTTLANYIADEANGEVKFAAFTGKRPRLSANKAARRQHCHSHDLWARERRRSATSTCGRGAGLQSTTDHMTMFDGDAELRRDLLSFGVPCWFSVSGATAANRPVFTEENLTQC
jgi:exodeoxyribonuclease-5